MRIHAISRFILCHLWRISREEVEDPKPSLQRSCQQRSRKSSDISSTAERSTLVCQHLNPSGEPYVADVSPAHRIIDGSCRNFDESKVAPGKAEECCPVQIYRFGFINMSSKLIILLPLAYVIDALAAGRPLISGDQVFAGLALLWFTPEVTSKTDLDYSF